LTRLGGVAYLRRNFPEALAAWEKALAIRRAIGDREGEGSSLLNIAQVYTSMGDYGAALPLLHRALDIQRTVGNRWWENAVWNALGIIALTVGDYAEARRCLTTAERLSASVGDESGVAIAKFNLAQVERECGDYASAFERLEDARRWAHDNDDREFEAQCLTESALTAELAGEPERAEAFASAALRLYEELGIQALMTTDLATLALVHLARGELEAACTLVDTLLRIFEQSEVHQIEYPQRALYVAACVAAADHNQSLARSCLRRARELILKRAEKISDDELRRSYLENVRINQMVLNTANIASTNITSSGQDSEASQ
jgi:tetratricopeptide (TPR) repeat protein